VHTEIKGDWLLKSKVLGCCAHWMHVLQKISGREYWQKSANRSATRGRSLLGSVGGGWHMAAGAHRLLPHQPALALDRLPY